MSDNDLKRRAGLYGSLRSVADAVRYEPVREALGDAFGKPGEGEYISGVRKTVAVDETWLKQCEDSLPHFAKAIEQSRSLIKKDGEVVRIDRAKRPSKDSVAHLARHSNMIKSVTDDGRLAPDEIYITENDEDLAVYENRFIYLALTQMQSFVSLRYEQIARAAAETGVSLKINRSSSRQNRTVSYELSVSETAGDGCGAADLIQQQTVSRIRNVLNSAAGFLQTALMKTVSSAPKLTPPIVRTNIIKNNVHFAQIYDLYMFLTAYAGPGFTVNEDVKNGDDVPESVSSYLCDIAALQFFTAYQGVFNGWEDSESLYEEEEENKRRQLVRRLKLDAENARDEMLRGAKTPEEYIALLEERNAMLSEAYEDLGGAMSELRKKERETHQSVIRLSAEHSMMRDRLKQTELSAEQRIRESKAAAERNAEAKADEKIRKKEEEHELERKAWQNENDLLTARLRAEGLINKEDGAFADIKDRDGFIKLEREHKALGSYFRDQWAKAKRRIRISEWKNRNGGGEDKE